MADDSPENDGESPDERGLLAECVAVLRQDKRWYVIPIVLALLLLTAVAVIGGRAAAPFVYTLF